MRMHMSKRTIFRILAAAMAFLCLTGAAAEEAGSLSRILNAGEELLLETSNVTLEGTAQFSLDGEEPFKKAEARYVQDEFSSLWRLKLLTPRYGAERVTGFTVIANGRKIYAMEDYHPGVYRFGDDEAQCTVIRDSAYLDQLISVCKSAAPGAERLIEGHIRTQETEEGTETAITLSGEDVPELWNGLMNLGAQFLIRRLFLFDYDRVSGYEGCRMEDFFTATQAILACTVSFTVQRLDLTVRLDTQGRITFVSGELETELQTRNDGAHRLAVSFEGSASLYGNSEVKDFDPEEYGVVPE